MAKPTFKTGSFAVKFLQKESNNDKYKMKTNGYLWKGVLEILIS